MTGEGEGGTCTRTRSLTGGSGRMNAVLRALDTAGVKELAIPRCGDLEARTARMPVRVRPRDTAAAAGQAVCFR